MTLVCARTLTIGLRHSAITGVRYNQPEAPRRVLMYFVLVSKRYERRTDRHEFKIIPI
jgi:hypothetical protein